MNKINQTYKLACYGILAIIILLPACSKEDAQQSKEVNAKQTKHLQKMEKLEQKRLVALENIKKMEMPELVDQMDRDANKGREPFNSNAYREITRNKKSQGASLFQELTKRKEVSYITLLALRTIDSANYKTLDQQLKLDVLLGEFARSKSYNKWGIPHLYWEDAAKSVIELGKPAEPGLISFLKDCQPAPVWGSEEVIVYETYKYRRCDYALAMLMTIRGEKVADIPESPKARNELIKRYRDK